MPTVPQAQAAINTLFYLGSTATSPASYSLIANVGDIGGPDMSADVKDVTSHSSLTPWKRKIATLLDSGKITLPLFFIPSAASLAGHDATSGLMYVFTSRSERLYKLVFPDTAATTWYFLGYITAFKIKAPVAGVLTADVEFTFTDEPTLV